MTSISGLPINFNISNVSIRKSPIGYNSAISFRNDNFAANPIYNGLESKVQIEKEANSNPRIKEIMQKYNLPIRANIEELENLKKGHLKNTRVIAAQTYSSLPKELKQEVNLQDLQTAAMLHDYGKVLIPKAILNKTNSFTEKEREIMQQHSEIGYELLKNKGLNENTLNLIKYHHQTPSGNGYPQIKDEFDYNISSQILNAADKYCALREERSYKPPLSREDALDIIRQDVQSGVISPEVYDALQVGSENFELSKT